MSVVESQKDGIGGFLHALFAGKSAFLANVPAFRAPGCTQELFFGFLLRGLILQDRLRGKESATLAFGRTPIAVPRKALQTSVAQTDWQSVSLQYGLCAVVAIRASKIGGCIRLLHSLHLRCAELVEYHVLNYAQCPSTSALVVGASRPLLNWSIASLTVPKTPV